MRTRALAGFLAMVLVLPSLGSWERGAAAQAPDHDTREAKTLFDDGVKLYKAGRYDEARVKFKAAYGLKRRPSVVLNLARSELQTKRPLEAATHFRVVMTLQDARAEDREDAKSGLLEARRQLGVVNIDAPTGTAVTVDGETHGQAPIEGGVDLLPGVHTVTIRTPAGKQTVERVTLTAGGTVTVAPASELPPPAVVPPVAPPASSAPSTPVEPPPAAPAPPVAKPDTEREPRTDVASTRRGFFASIHPVTYVGLAATAAFGGLWLGFYRSSQTHKDNAARLAQFLKDNPSTPERPRVNREGIDEVNAANKQANLATAFAITTGVAATTTLLTLIFLRRTENRPVTVSATPLFASAGAPGSAHFAGGTISFAGSF